MRLFSYCKCFQTAVIKCQNNQLCFRPYFALDASSAFASAAGWREHADDSKLELVVYKL
jgi:hypothetical protein